MNEEPNVITPLERRVRYIVKIGLIEKHNTRDEWRIPVVVSGIESAKTYLAFPSKQSAQDAIDDGLIGKEYVF